MLSQIRTHHFWKMVFETLFSSWCKCFAVDELDFLLYRLNIDNNKRNISRNLSKVNTDKKHSLKFSSLIAPDILNIKRPTWETKLLHRNKNLLEKERESNGHLKQSSWALSKSRSLITTLWIHLCGNFFLQTTIKENTIERPRSMYRKLPCSYWYSYLFNCFFLMCSCICLSGGWMVLM